MTVPDIHLLVMTNGDRGHIVDTVESFYDCARGCTVKTFWINDDSGDVAYRSRLRYVFDAFGVEVWNSDRSGFGGAIQRAWQNLCDQPGAPWVFHLEDDFTFNREFWVDEMVHVMELHPHLAQMALRRQPWNPTEKLAGGVVEMHPDAYTEHLDARGNAWLEHRLFLTTNPSVYRRSLCAMGWPDGANSEGTMSHRLIQNDPDLRFAYWGSRDSGEAVRHNGDKRTGHGY